MNRNGSGVALYKLNLFGEFQLHCPHGTGVALAAKKAKALVAYLALQSEAMQPREWLAALLWEDCNSARARHNLRQTVSLLRKQLPDADPLLESTQQSLALRRDRIEIDTDRFDRLCTGRDEVSLQQAFDLYRGELLKGMYTGSQSFDDWLETERSQRRENALKVMDRLLEIGGGRSELETMIRLGIAILATDPLRESAHRVLMEAYHKQGRRGAALKQYHQCRQILRNELGIAPEPATQALYQSIYQQQAPIIKQPVEAPLDMDPDRQPPPETAKSGEKLRQLRQVSLLYVQLHHSGFDHDPESEYLQSERIRCEIQRSVEEFKADSCEYQQECLLLVFGIAHARTHDTEAAVRAAFALQDCLQQQPDWAAGIGISSGRVFVPDSNPSEQQKIPLSGATVKQAMALGQSALPGQILCTERAYLSVSRLVRAILQDPDDRIRQPQAIWQLSELIPSPRRPAARMVGREFELQQFANLCQTCRQTGHGKVLLLRGDPGIGKSRLLQEWQNLATAAGYASHAVSVFAFGTVLDQNPIPMLLRSLLQLTPDSTVEDLKSRASQAIDAGLLDEEQLNFLYDRLDKPELLIDSELYYAMENETRQHGRQQVLNTLVQRSARRTPLLLVVDDIHWADPPLLTALGELAVDSQDLPVILAFSTRLEEEPQDPIWRARLQSAALLTLDISPLAEDEAVAMAAQAEDLAPEQRKSLVQRAGGNPLFLEQLLLYAREGVDTVPDSVQNIVAAKLDTLDAYDKRALFAAAILGQRFSQAALNFILGDPDYHCANLVGRGLIRPVGALFQFHHALIMEGIDAIQIPSQRRSLHRRAADWYRERDAVLYAGHLDKAESNEAADAYLAAAQHLMSAYRYEDAESIAARGRELAIPGETRFELCLCHAQCQRELGRVEAALELFNSAEQLASEPRQQCRALIGQGFTLRLQDRHEEILALAQRAEPLAAGLDDSEALATLYNLRGGASFFLGSIDECLAAHRKAEALAVSHQMALTQIRAASGIADAYYASGQMISAEQKFSECIALCHQHHQIRDAAVNQMMVGVVRHYLGQYEDAENALQEALARLKKVKSWRSEAMCLVELAFMAIQNGQPEIARNHAQQSLRIARALGSPRIECDNLLYLGIVDKNQAILEQAYQMAEVHPFGEFYISSWILGVLAWVTDDSEKRAWALEKGEQLLSARVLSHNHLMFFRYAIEACLNSRDFTRAEYYMARLKHYTRTEPLPWSEFFLRRADCLIRVARKQTPPADLKNELKELIQETKEAGLNAAKPELENALKTLESMAGAW